MDTVVEPSSNSPPETENTSVGETENNVPESTADGQNSDGESSHQNQTKTDDDSTEVETEDQVTAGETDQESTEKIGPGDDGTIDITPEKSSGVLKKILREGEGEEYPGYGDRVSVHYTGWLLQKDPEVFDSNTKEDKFEFNLGRGMVIKGWDLGISTMKRGEVAMFIVHPKYAYGDMGYPPTIPPRTPLLFEIKLFDWKLDDLSPKKDESILRKVLEKGEGNAAPNDGSKVKVEIIQYMDDDETLTEERWFLMGEGCVYDIPEGLEIALQRFAVGEKSLIYLRNKYVEDVKGLPQGSDMTPDEIKFQVTLLEFEKAKNIWEMNSDEKLERALLAKEKGIKYYTMGLYEVALKQFKWIVTCLENEPGISPETQESRKSLLLSGYLNIALCQRKLENHLSVIKVCNKALALDPDNEKALFRRGQAKVEMNDCEEALADFQNLCSLKPENKAARNYVIVCQKKMKEQMQKDKSTYNKMFDLFVKQDEERLKNMKTETGVWENDKSEDSAEGGEGKEHPHHHHRQRGILNANSNALLDANVIEISNTANGNISFDL